jgi:serine/threonine-protein kinase
VAAIEKRVSLRALIFLLSASLVVLVVGASIGFSYQQGHRLADEAVDDTLSRSVAIQSYFDRLRFRQLELITELFASDPYFVSYLSDSLGGGLFGEAEVDTASVADLLIERQQDLGFDLAMVLDDQGLLLAHTNRDPAEGENLEARPLVAQLIADLEPVTGTWQEVDGLYQVAMVPLATDDSLIGFLVAGLLVDNALAEGIKNAIGADLIIFSSAGVAASTLAPDDTQSALGQLQTSQVTGDAAANTTHLTLFDQDWVASLTPLSEGDAGSAQFASLISMDEVLAGHRELQRAMIMVGAAMVVIGLLLSLVLARMVARPLTRFAHAATAASKGDYGQRFKVSGDDEIAELGEAFDTLLSDLREKRDMESYVADLSRYLPDPGTSETVVGRREPQTTTAESRYLALLGLEFHHLSKQAGSGDAADNLRELEAELSQLADEAESRGGKIEAVMGHRALISFQGNEACSQALQVAALLAAGDDAHLPSMALVTGEVDRGTISTHGIRSGILIGKASHQVDLLTEESVPGKLLLSPQVKEEVSSSLADSDARLVVVEGRMSKRRYYALSRDSLKLLKTVDEEQTVRAEPMQSTESSSTTSRTVGVGELFADRYEVISVLGSGGMGMVYKALDRDLDDFVALKTLLPELASDANYLEQLKEEIRLARKITHVNVLRTYDFGSFEGTAFISMEYVRGMTLRYLLQQRPHLPYSAGLRIARQLCSALGAAHSEEVIHRDIKPENLILESNGNVKLMDFGIARPVKKLDTEEAQGVFVGTPRYAAPEQMEGRRVDSRADVFACGVMMYEVFTGVAPYNGRTILDIYNHHALPGS